MNDLVFKNNYVEIVGEAVSDFEYSHTIFGKVLYRFFIKIKRWNGNSDIIPVIVPEKTVKMKEAIGSKIKVIGQWRSYSFHEEEKNHLILYLFSKELKKAEENVKNTIFLYGFICKEPIYRKTPLGKEITELLLAVNRLNGKTDYIPCICWGRNARYISQFPVGTEVKLEGRIQSREYIKKLDDGTQETRIAYEVLVSRIDVVESGE